MTDPKVAIEDEEPEAPCCTYVDHGGDRPACACPEHPQSALHPYGYVAGGRR